MVDVTCTKCGKLMRELIPGKHDTLINNKVCCVCEYIGGNYENRQE